MQDKLIQNIHIFNIFENNYVLQLDNVYLPVDFLEYFHSKDTGIQETVQQANQKLEYLLYEYICYELSIVTPMFFHEMHLL